MKVGVFFSLFHLTFGQTIIFSGQWSRNSHTMYMEAIYVLSSYVTIALTENSDPNVTESTMWCLVVLTGGHPLLYKWVFNGSQNKEVWHEDLNIWESWEDCTEIERKIHLPAFPTFFSYISKRLSSHSNLGMDDGLLNVVPVRLCSIEFMISRKSGVTSPVISEFNFVQTNFLINIIWPYEEPQQNCENEI